MNSSGPLTLICFIFTTKFQERSIYCLLRFFKYFFFVFCSTGMFKMIEVKKLLPFWTLVVFLDN